MPVIKSAIKKLRKDKRHEKENNKFRNKLDKAIREAKKLKSAKSVNAAFSLIDRGTKKNILHKNRAARLKSSLAKLARLAAKRAKPIPKSKTPKVKK